MAIDLKLEPVHIAQKKKIGKVGSNPVFEVLTSGGLWVHILGKGAGFDILSTGPHKAVARYIAEQKEPNLEWTELSKSEWVPFEDYAHLIPKYMEMTDELRARHNGE